jgi:hypothetical protein
MEVRFCPQCGRDGLGRSRAPYLFDCVLCDLIFICLPADGADVLGLTPRQLFAVDELRFAQAHLGDKEVTHAD